MRRINPARFQVAKRGTSREINSQIVLNLVRTHQPISRADLARAMGVSRASVTLIVNDLIARKLVFEGATGEAVRGRKPTFLYIDARRRTVVAADIRASETFLMLADLLGKPLTGVISFPTVRDPQALVAALAARIKALVAEHSAIGTCEDIGVVVPGMVEQATMRVPVHPAASRPRSASSARMPVTTARLAVNLALQAGREDWWPVRLRMEQAGYRADPIFGKSNLIFTLAAADGLLRVPPDATGLSAGDLVEVFLI